MGRIGPYRISELLGRGGMGYVFAATDGRLRREVAVKLMRENVGTTADAKRRFVAEARSMAAITHDNVATIFEVGLHRGMPLMAMERLRGHPLSDETRPGTTFEVARILTVAIDVARGLEAAAEQGIVHRDIKPANLWVDERTGRHKILDFGLAVDGHAVKSLTSSTSVVGSPGYLSPEQARSDVVDHRTDLYSLGVILYQMSTGQLPLVAKDIASQLIAILCHAPIPPTRHRPDLPTPLERFILRLLEKEPGDRFGTATEVVRAAERLKDELASGSTARFPALTVTDTAAASKPRAKPGKRTPAVEPEQAAAASRRPGSSRKPATKIHYWATAGTVAVAGLLFAIWQPWQSRRSASAVKPSVAANNSSDQTTSANSSPAVARVDRGNRIDGDALATATRAEAKDMATAAATNSTPQTLKPWTITDSVEHPKRVPAGHALSLRIRVMNDAGSDSVDVQSVRRLPQAAQIQTFVVPETGQPQPLGYPLRLRGRRLPEAGQTSEIDVQLWTAGMEPGEKRLRIDLQTPDGRSVSSTETTLKIDAAESDDG